MPGVCPGGGGHAEASISPTHKLKAFSRLPVFTVFKDELEARKWLKAFFLQPKL